MNQRTNNPYEPPRHSAGSGGTGGGVGQFILGFILACLGLYFFFNSVYVTSEGGGIIGRGMRRAFGGGGGGGGGGGHWGRTTSMGIIFIPLFVGLIMLFNNARRMAGWIVMLIGLAILVIEILSMLTFEFKFKTSDLIIMMVLTAAGLGFMLNSYRDFTKTYANPPDQAQQNPPQPGDFPRRGTGG